MKIDLNKSLIDLEGKEIADSNMGKIVAQTLITGSKGDALKFWDWANKLYKGEVLDLDKSDQEVFKNFIKENEEWSLMEVRAAKLAIEQYKTANGDLPPGVNYREERVVNIRRSQ